MVHTILVPYVPPPPNTHTLHKKAKKTPARTIISIISCVLQKSEKDSAARNYFHYFKRSARKTKKTLPHGIISLISSVLQKKQKKKTLSRTELFPLSHAFCFAGIRDFFLTGVHIKPGTSHTDDELDLMDDVYNATVAHWGLEVKFHYQIRPKTYHVHAIALFNSIVFVYIEVSLSSTLDL